MVRVDIANIGESIYIIDIYIYNKQKGSKCTEWPAVKG